jgi:hypothetical protein
MIWEVKMSPHDDNPEGRKKKQKKYLWFGYGSEGSHRFQPVNIRGDPTILDKLLELLGVKEEPRKESAENKQLK